MNPATLLIIEAAIKYGPTLGLAIAEILHRTDTPTIEEWRALFAKVKTYDEYVRPLPDLSVPSEAQP